VIKEFREGRLMEYKRQRNKLYNCYLTRQETHIQIHIYSQLRVEKHRETEIKTERYIGTQTRREQKLRMRDSYKRFVKTWIRFANPWIRFVS
jgi:hypothetical protein